MRCTWVDEYLGERCIKKAKICPGTNLYATNGSTRIEGISEIPTKRRRSVDSLSYSQTLACACGSCCRRSDCEPRISRCHGRITARRYPDTCLEERSRTMKERKIFAINNFQVVIATLAHEGGLHDHGHSARLEQRVEIRRKH
jgi:hypothetical protein